MTKHILSSSSFLAISLCIIGQIIVIHSQSNMQYIQLYNSLVEQNGNITYTLKTNVGEPNLDLHPNLNGVKDCQARGIWIFYSGQNYTGTSTLIWDSIYTFCTWKPFPELGHAKSVRFAGVQRSAPHNTASITLYDGVNFNGEDLVLSAANSNVTFPFTSFISTSMQNMALYTGIGYTGSSVCIQPSTDVTQAKNIATLGLMRGQVKSIQFSC